jgi:small GTP-binding protein
VSGHGDERKAALRDLFVRLARLARAAGLASAADDIEHVRIPKLDEGRFSLVVLGEFNHGKSTLINALLGETLLPAGITPTTAVLTEICHGDTASAEAVMEDGQRVPVAPTQLASWLTVEGAATRERLDHVEVRHPAALLRERVTIVDTPGVNDINEQRADITYGYVPRADAALFLLDATQILSNSERRFLEDRILRSCRERLVFVVTKADLLDAAELEEACSFARRHLSALVPAPALFPVSARRALAGDRERGRMEPLLAHLHLTLGAERARVLDNNVLSDAARLSAFVRDSLGMRRRSLELPPEDLAARVTRAQDRLRDGRHALAQAANTISAEAAACKSRLRQDLESFATGFAAALPPDIDSTSAADVQRYLGPFLQDTWKAWLETEGDWLAGELDRLAEKAIEVANQRVQGITDQVAEELSSPEARLHISVDTFKYDASVFAVGALGTTVFFFVNALAGGLMTLAAPVLAVLLKNKADREIKAEAREAAPEAVRKAAALLGPKLDRIVDDFSERLREFIAEAGAALARGIAEVLERALTERRLHAENAAASDEAHLIDETLSALAGVEARIAELRRAVWQAD